MVLRRAGRSSDVQPTTIELQALKHAEPARGACPWWWCRNQPSDGEWLIIRAGLEAMRRSGKRPLEERAINARVLVEQVHSLADVRERNQLLEDLGVRVRALREQRVGRRTDLAVRLLLIGLPTRRIANLWRTVEQALEAEGKDDWSIPAVAGLLVISSRSYLTQSFGQLVKRVESIERRLHMQMKPTTKDLASQYGVSVRTVYRWKGRP